MSESAQVVIRGKLIAKAIKNLPCKVGKFEGLPKLGDTKDQEDPLLMIKLFDTCGSWSWYIIAYDSETEEAFGYVDGDFPEFGYFNVRELREVLGGRLEKDKFFKPLPLSQLSKK